MNEVIGEREYFLDKHSIGTISLVADKGYKLDPVTYAVNKMIAFITSPWLFVALFVLALLFVMAERRRRRIIRKKRREMRNRRNRELIEQMEYIRK